MSMTSRRASPVRLDHTAFQRNEFHPKKDTEAFLHEIIESIEADSREFDHLPDIPFKFFVFYANPAVCAFLKACWEYFEFLAGQDGNHGGVTTQDYEHKISRCYSMVLLESRKLIDYRSMEEEKKFWEFWMAFCYELLKRHSNPAVAAEMKAFLEFVFRGPVFRRTKLGRLRAPDQTTVSAPLSQYKFSSRAAQSPFYRSQGIKERQRLARTRPVIAKKAQVRHEPNELTKSPPSGERITFGAAAARLEARIMGQEPQTELDAPTKSAKEKSGARRRRRSLALVMEVPDVLARKPKPPPKRSKPPTKLPPVPRHSRFAEKRKDSQSGDDDDYRSYKPRSLALSRVMTKEKHTNRVHVLRAAGKQSPALRLMLPAMQHPARRQPREHPTTYRKLTARRPIRKNQHHADSRTKSRMQFRQLRESITQQAREQLRAASRTST